MFTECMDKKREGRVKIRNNKFIVWICLHEKDSTLPFTPTNKRDPCWTAIITASNKES